MVENVFLVTESGPQWGSKEWDVGGPEHFMEKMTNFDFKHEA